MRRNCHSVIFRAGHSSTRQRRLPAVLAKHIAHTRTRSHGWRGSQLLQYDDGSIDWQRVQTLFARNGHPVPPFLLFWIAHATFYFIYTSLVCALFPNMPITTRRVIYTAWKKRGGGRIVINTIIHSRYNFSALYTKKRGKKKKSSVL